METFALYLIKSSVWLTGFFLIYVLFLRNERFFVLNRIYLVSGILVSLVFPIFTWHYTVIFPVTPTAEVLEPQVVGVTTVDDSFPIQKLLLYFYLTGALYLIFRLIKQTVAVWKVIRNSETHHFNSIKLIRTDRYPASFSFFSFVFVNPSIDETETNEIVNHEQEHIRQQHWIDLLLFEILRTMHWFNPVSWLYGRLIRQNHEYLADERALQRSSNPAIYRAALLNQMFGGPVISLANSFNYSLNKKRFNMMKQITYSPFRKLKLLLVLPLIAGVFYAFATPEYKFTQAEKSSDTVNQTQEEKTVKGKIVTEDGTPLRGASIAVKNSTNNTLSGENGFFELKVEDDAPLVFSFAGYDSKEVKPDFFWQMLIVMKTKTIKIEDVGNKPSDGEPTRVHKPILTLIDGKEISPEVAKENLSNKFNRNPLLVVIDGVISPNKNLDNIDPETIESIDILKDETATKKYGEKGKNGVILITTKKGASSSQNTPIDVKVTGYANNQRTVQPETKMDNALIIVDGKEITKTEMDKINPETIESVSVLKDKISTLDYGEKGKNGVILITMKKETPSFEFSAKEVQQKIGEGITIKEPDKFKIVSKDGKQPQLVIDGVVSSKKIEDIDPKTIESIIVLEGESATVLYGEKGKNGVVSITLKKDKSINQNKPIDVKVTRYANNKKDNPAKSSIIEKRNGLGSEYYFGEKQPLIVIDGVVTTNKKMHDIAPETIESIKVLKDDKFAITKYGVKGENGVLEITLKKSKEVFDVVEEMPEFPGGFVAMKAFVAATLKYPTFALENGIQGQVTVGFTVAADGSVTDAKIKSGVDPSLDQEAVRIVNSMHKWKPGMQRGMPVSVKYEMPINFTYPADYHPKSKEKLREKK